jgi:mannitol-1-phosphate/altronate dehydrogenase
VPPYDRSALTVGIVHLGVGGFHRAHEAMYLDGLMRRGEALDWAVCGVGVLPGDARMRDALTAQDGLYTLVEKAPDGTWAARVVGSIVEYLLAPDDPERVVERMADPAVRIVSLTVTEGGYNVDPVTGEFVSDAPDVVHDVEEPKAPRTSFGLVVEALARRRDRGVPPFTVMSCDNIPGNGQVARRSFAAFAALRDPELADWVRTAVSFPDSMVDRITPATTDADRAEVQQRYGITDRWPVVCEPFTQWVLQDAFGDGRPPWEDAGVQLVDDVEPYELMKLRLLNASHQGLCYFGHLAGYRLVHEVAQDPLFADFLLAYMQDEGSPTLPPVPGVDLDGLPPRAGGPLLERPGAGHRRPAVRGELGPHPDVAAPGGAGEPGRRPVRAAVGRDRRELGPVRRGRRRAGRADRGRRPAARTAHGRRRAAPAGPVGLPAGPLAVRRPRRRPALRRAVRVGARPPAPRGRAGDARGAARARRPRGVAVRVAVLRGPGDLTVEERPAPTAAPGEVVVRIASVGVCGSDTHYYEHGRIGRFVVEQPLVLGHEASGEVVELGAGVTALRVGQRVSLEPGVPTSSASSAGPAATTSARTCASSPRRPSTGRSPSSSRCTRPSPIPCPTA